MGLTERLLQYSSNETEITTAPAIAPMGSPTAPSPTADSFPTATFPTVITDPPVSPTSHSDDEFATPTGITPRKNGLKSLFNNTFYAFIIVCIVGFVCVLLFWKFCK